jgi:hypothetical protein
MDMSIIDFPIPNLFPLVIFLGNESANIDQLEHTYKSGLRVTHIVFSIQINEYKNGHDLVEKSWAEME